MKRTRFPVKDKNGISVAGWSFKSFQGVWNCGGNIKGKGRKINGWSLFSPDGVERCCEGNWLGFVPFVKEILDNHDCTTSLS